MNLIKPSFSTGYAKNASESANPNLWKGLVGAWMPSFGVTGNTLKDVSGNGNDGTLTNMDAASDWVATSKGLALDFDGSGEHVNCGYILNEEIDNALTMTCFCTPAVFGGFQNIFAKPFLYWLHQEQGVNRFRFKVRATSGVQYVQADVPITLGQTYFLTGVMSKNTLKIYVDGKFYASQSFVGSLYRTSIHDLKIGGWIGTNDDFTGSIGNASIYNRALSPTEIKQLYLNPSAPFQKKTTTVVSVPVAPPTTTAKAVVLKKPKPSYATGYARNASESANPNLWKGLVGAWMPSFGVTGNTLKDVSGNGNDGTLAAGMDLASDWLIDNKQIVLDFDGVDDGVSVTANFAEQFNDGFTICSLVKTRTTSSKTNAIAGEWGNGGAGNASYLLYQRFSKFYAATYNTALGGLSIQSSQNILANKWYHLVFTHTYDGGVANRGTEKLWIQGRLDATLATMPTPQQSTNYPFTIGKELTTNADAQIGFISLHKRVLSPTEIKQLYLNPSAPFLRKQQTVGISTAAVVPSANFNPFSVLTHPLEQ